MSESESGSGSESESASDSRSPSTFTEAEEFRLTMLPSLVGSAVAFSSKSGVIGTAKEMMANAKSASAGTEDYPDNSIIRMVLPAFEDRSEAMDRAKAIRDKQLEQLDEAGISTREQMKTHALSEAAAVNELLAAKASATEAAQYRQWVMGVANAVATAAKEGGFLGFGGEEVSEGEVETLAEISSALGLEGGM